MDRLEIRQEVIGKEAGKVLVLRVNGYIDASNVDRFDSDVHKAIDEAGFRNLVVSLEGVEYINSSGLGVLISASQKLSKDGFFCLAAVPEKISRIILLLGFGQIIEIYESVEQALAQQKGLVSET